MLHIEPRGVAQQLEKQSVVLVCVQVLALHLGTWSMCLIKYVFGSLEEALIGGS
jgi:hypothetical protein